MPIEQNIPNDPKIVSQITKSILGRELAPSTRQQSAEYANWRAIADAPVDPYNVERIPLSRLRQMRRDPMIAFAMHFVKTPLVRAPWYIKCPDAQVAAFVDYALRRIYGRLVMQYMLSLDFGFSAIAKKFVQEPILDTFFDPTKPADQQSPDQFLLPNPQAAVPADLQGTERPIWSEGSVLPTIWKPFVPLAPEEVEIIWGNSGEFDGIKYTPRFQVTTQAGGSKGSNEGDLEIDLVHSLWITNDRDSVFGNVFGYPRIGHAYNYWWSYWHQHSLYDRHFEKDADPPTVVRHPDGNYTDPDTGETISFRELALDIGDRIRSGSTIAMPSDVYANFEDRPSNTYKWDIEFLTGGGNFDHFIESFDYLNVAKLRAVWVPEQALIEGKGGQSSRNVADTFGDAFQESQAVLLNEFDLHINQFIIPQLVSMNFPEFEGKAEKVTRGFSNKDVETSRQLIQLIGQTDMSKLPVDVRQLLEDVAIPLMDPVNQAEDIKRAAASAPPPVAPQAGSQAGVVPTPGVTSPPNQLPFSYVQPLERIVIPQLGVSLADEFISNLPKTDHYSDKIMRQYASQLYTAFNKLYKGQYEHFIEWMQKQELQLADEPDWVKKLVARWTAESGDADLWATTVMDVKSIYNNSINRSAKLAANKYDLDATISASDSESIEFINNQLGTLVRSVATTIQDDLTRNLATALSELEDPQPGDIANELRSRLADYPDWQAARVARTEIRELFNNATLLAGQQNGVKKVQIVDAVHSPTDDACEDRNGDIMSIGDAFDVEEHPNGTLAFRLLAADNINIKITDDAQQLGRLVPESNTIELSAAATREQRMQILLAYGEKLSHGS